MCATPIGAGSTSGGSVVRPVPLRTIGDALALGVAVAPRGVDGVSVSDDAGGRDTGAHASAIPIAAIPAT